MVARTLATQSAGLGLVLIGGFRYRLISQSGRASLDLDYHFDGDLDAKRKEVSVLLRRRLPGEIRWAMDLDCDVRDDDRPGEGADFVRTIEVAVYRVGARWGRVEIPVDLTRLPCLDRPVAVTVDGVVYLAASDADMIEGKILALFLRAFVAARDVLDVFLYARDLVPAAAERLDAKLGPLGLGRPAIQEKFAELVRAREVHIRGLEHVIREQLDAGPAARLEEAGGAAAVFDECMAVARRALRLEPPA